MENQNYEFIDKFETPKSWVLASLAMGCLYFAIYLGVTPTALQILVECCPQLEQKIESDEPFALFIFSWLIISAIIIIAPVCEAIQHALTQKPIPDDNILDAPDEL